uniref:Uncharacterized protein n=1 Tax=Arundo donax TaxID=35708 RepID=A0A0A9G1X1_ARUDO
MIKKHTCFLKTCCFAKSCNDRTVCHFCGIQTMLHHHFKKLPYCIQLYHVPQARSVYIVNVNQTTF